MKCPVCQKEMQIKNFGNVHVDICEDGCKGLWFDWFELSKLDEHNEGVGKALEEALNYPRINTGNRERLNCPKCNMPMFTHKYESAKEINVDECYNCAGFFLDSGELYAVRDSYMSEEEAQEYLHDLVTDVPALKQAQEDRAKKNQRVAAIDKYTKYLRVSYYMNGK